jgi:hypothetical protein
MKYRLLWIACVTVLTCSFFSGNMVPLPGVAWASTQESWRGEFDDIASAASDAMSLSIPELEKLLARCAALKMTIETLEESPRKVYGKRLQMTRDLLQFMLESKKNQPPVPSTPPTQ